MERLKVRDLRALLDFLRRCYAAQDLDEFVAALTSGLADLIPPVVAETHVLTLITCSRNHPDFSDRERLLLNLVRPHIAEARRNAETLTLLKQGGGESGPGLLITEHGRVGQTDARSLALVQEYFGPVGDRKSTRLNSSHGYISYAVFCLKKK